MPSICKKCGGRKSGDKDYCFSCFFNLESSNNNIDDNASVITTVPGQQNVSQNIQQNKQENEQENVHQNVQQNVHQINRPPPRNKNKTVLTDMQRKKLFPYFSKIAKLFPFIIVNEFPYIFKQIFNEPFETIYNGNNDDIDILLEFNNLFEIEYKDRVNVGHSKYLPNFTVNNNIDTYQFGMLIKFARNYEYSWFRNITFASKIYLSNSDKKKFKEFTLDTFRSYSHLFFVVKHKKYNLIVSRVYGDNWLNDANQITQRALDIANVYVYDILPEIRDAFGDNYGNNNVEQKQEYYSDSSSESIEDGNNMDESKLDSTIHSENSNYIDNSSEMKINNININPEPQPIKQNRPIKPPKPMIKNVNIKREPEPVKSIPKNVINKPKNNVINKSKNNVINKPEPNNTVHKPGVLKLEKQNELDTATTEANQLNNTIKKQELQINQLKTKKNNILKENKSYSDKYQSVSKKCLQLKCDNNAINELNLNELLSLHDNLIENSRKVFKEIQKRLRNQSICKNCSTKSIDSMLLCGHKGCFKCLREMVKCYACNADIQGIISIKQ